MFQYFNAPEEPDLTHWFQPPFRPTKRCCRTTRKSEWAHQASAV